MFFAGDLKACRSSTKQTASAYLLFISQTKFNIKIKKNSRNACCWGLRKFPKISHPLERMLDCDFWEKWCWSKSSSFGNQRSPRPGWFEAASLINRRVATMTRFVLSEHTSIFNVGNWYHSFRGNQLFLNVPKTHVWGICIYFIYNDTWT